MKMPSRLEPLYHSKLIEEVVGQLKSGKEAEVYIVRSGDEFMCAKVYKDAINRTFKHTTDYTDGRNTRNSRDRRAMNKKSRYGKQESESEWQSNEVDALRLLAGVGVRVPKVLHFNDGVLLMEIVCDAEGNPAPRLNDVELTRDQAVAFFPALVRDVVRMLCAGVIHGDLSEFNVLLSHDGPVIIDLPQVVQATSNNAEAMLTRDVSNLRRYFSQFAQELATQEYAAEVWKLYKHGKLKPDSPLTGVFETDTSVVDLSELTESIEDVRTEELIRLGVIPRRRK